MPLSCAYFAQIWVVSRASSYVTLCSSSSSLRSSLRSSAISFLVIEWTTNCSLGSSIVFLKNCGCLFPYALLLQVVGGC